MLFNSLLGSNDLNYSKQKNTRIDFIVYRAFTLLLWVVFFFLKYLLICLVFLWVFYCFCYSNKNNFKSLPSGVELELFYGQVNWFAILLDILLWAKGKDFSVWIAVSVPYCSLRLCITSLLFSPCCGLTSVAAKCPPHYSLLSTGQEEKNKTEKLMGWNRDRDITCQFELWAKQTWSRGIFFKLTDH